VKGFIEDIESIAVKNQDFRQVLYTAKNCQLVVMALKPGEEIGRKCTSWISSFAWKKGPGRDSRRRADGDPGRFCGHRSGRHESQYHQHRQFPAQAVHDLRTTQSPGRRYPPYRRRCGGRQGKI